MKIKKEYRIINNELNVNFITISALWWGFDNTLPYDSYKFNKLTRKKIKHTFSALAKRFFLGLV